MVFHLNELLQWALRLLFKEKCLPHESHGYGCRFWEPWDIIWRLRHPLKLKAFSHLVHLCAFSALCIFICLFRSSFSLYDFSHRSHWKGRSDEWDSICLLKFPLVDRVYWIDIIHMSGNVLILFRYVILSVYEVSLHFWRDLHMKGMGDSVCQELSLSWKL